MAQSRERLTKARLAEELQSLRDNVKKYTCMHDINLKQEFLERFPTSEDNFLNGTMIAQLINSDIYRIEHIFKVNE